MSWGPMKVTIYQDELLGEYVHDCEGIYRVLDADDFFFTLRECELTDNDDIVEFDDGYHDRYVNSEEMAHILRCMDGINHKIKMWTRQEEFEDDEE